MTASKKGVSAHQVHRMLGVSYKSTWFMMHRLREAMRTGGLEPLGGAGKVVEADETYFGKRRDDARLTAAQGPSLHQARQGPATSAPSSRWSSAAVRFARSMSPVADQATVASIVRENVARESRLHTDESNLYSKVGLRRSPRTKRVKHTADEYVRGDVTTNTVESYFSMFKRGMRGVYQHCGEKHLHRYLAEFDFRYNNRIALGRQRWRCAPKTWRWHRRQAPHLSTA